MIIKVVSRLLLYCNQVIHTCYLNSPSYKVFQGFVIIVGSLMYYIEDTGENGAGFTTIPMGMYWAIQTLFTVGYGDIVPFTLFLKS